MIGRLVLSLVVLGVFSAVEGAPSLNAGFRRLETRDPVSGASFPVAVWYPTRSEPAHVELTGTLTPCGFPAMLCPLLGTFAVRVARDAAPAEGTFGLIVISHGAGGLALNHRDLAMALASHGYVVAAPAHPRGDGNDITGAGVWVGRPRQVSRVIDRLLDDRDLGPRIQRARIGIVGHSNGGYTALAAAGATPSPGAVVQHCRRYPDDVRFCAHGSAASREAARTAGDIPGVHDSRVRAVVLMAPNGAWFTDDALAKVAVAVRIYGAEHDDLTVTRYHAQRLAKALPPRTEYVLVKGAGHFSFVASFPRPMRFVVGEAGRDPDGFNRDAMHAAMNPEIVAFFDRAL